MAEKIARHTPALTGDKAVRLVVADTALLPHVGDVLASLTFDYNWEEIGDTVPDIVAASLDILTDYYDNMLIGLVSQFLSDAPPGWLTLDGQTHLKVDYEQLWLALPDSLKDATSFTLPDMEDRFPMGTPLSSSAGYQAGANLYQLTIGQLPPHTHDYLPPVMDLDSKLTPPSGVTARAGALTPTTSTGNGDDIDNRPAYTAFVFAVYAGQ